MIPLFSHTPIPPFFPRRLTSWAVPKASYGFVVVMTAIFLSGSGCRTTTSRGLPGFRNTTPYFVYYGNWTPVEIMKAGHYKLVIIHPKTNIRRAIVRVLQAQGVMVFGYLSVGEDDTYHKSEATGGEAGADGKSANWYYYDERNRLIKNPDLYSGSYYVNPSNPHWRRALRKYRNRSKEGWFGYEYIMNVLGCDGLFLDTIDTAGPRSWNPDYDPDNDIIRSTDRYFGENEAMAKLVSDIKSDIGRRKHIMLNRGLFYYADDQPYYSVRATARLRSTASAVMYESYIRESSDQRTYWEGKLAHHSHLPDGFSVVTLDYDPGKTDEICRRTLLDRSFTPYVTGDQSLNTAAESHVKDWIRERTKSGRPPRVRPNP